MSESLCPSPPELVALAKEVPFAWPDVRRAWLATGSIMATRALCSWAAASGRGMDLAIRYYREAMTA